MMEEKRWIYNCRPVGFGSGSRDANLSTQEGKIGDGSHDGGILNRKISMKQMLEIIACRESLSLFSEQQGVLFFVPKHLILETIHAIIRTSTPLA